MRRLASGPRFYLLAVALLLASLPLRAQSPDSVRAKAKVHTDSIRAAFTVAYNAARAADSVDAILARLKSDTVRITLPPIHDTLPPLPAVHDTVPVYIRTDSVTVARVRALADSINRTATNARVKAWATRIDSLQRPPPLVPPDTTPTPPDTTPPTPIPTPGPNGLTIAAALPLVYLDFPYTAATGRTIAVLAGANLQTAINSAQRGDEIVLSAGATFTGNFTLPAKPGTLANGWITIRSDKLSQLPPEGTRVTSAHAGLMPTIVTPNSSAAIATQAGASGYRLVGLDVTATATYAGPQYGLVLLGDGSSAQRTLAQVPTDLVLDRVYVHGQANTELSRCVSLNSARTQITDSYLAECHAKGIDSQAIQGFNGPGPYKIVNNTLIGAGENIMFGGADPWIPGMIPSDIEIRRNYIFTPPSWKGKWLKKNLLELKAGQRILIEGNVLDGSWTDGQTGWAFMLKTSNQSGGCTWCTTSDVTIRYNYIRNAGAGIAISGREGSSPHPVGALAARFSVQNNVMDNVNIGVFNGDQRFVQVLGGAADVEITNNTTTSTGYMATFLFMDVFPTATRLAYSRNVASVAQYGMLATARGEGLPALGAVAGGWQFNGNYLIGATRSSYPAGTTFVSSLAAVPSGFGADQATVNARIAGVIIP